jgi:hypothetical protein
MHMPKDQTAINFLIDYKLCNHFGNILILL